jgi:hypothetical protein
MKMIDKDRVLRLNCPGFGEEAHLNLGRAKTLDNYQVIIANPVSLLHLFDKGPEPTRRISQLMSEGSNQLNVPDDALIQELINESDARLEELIPFLSQGGFLIYFLCRPFVLAGPTISVDNYDWLSVYAPATKNPPENGSRQMSAVSHGRIIEPTEEGEQSEMAEYLGQQGVEWNTIIRTDFLSSNYSVMATAGAKKCIAAQFWAGDNGGKVVFLPAPYSPDFDKVLMGCVDKWYQEALRQGTIKESTSAPVAGPKEDPAFHKPTGPDFYNGEQLETPATINELATPMPAPVVYAPPPLSSLLNFPGDLPAAVEIPKAQMPKGALKSLLSSDLLDDDDDEFTTDLPPGPAAAPAQPAPQAVKLTAEDILASVSQETTRRSPAEALAKAVMQASFGETSVDAETPKTVEPEIAQVSNFELKKATAEMDLSQFAQTARQLVEQANVIESATRDPARDVTRDAYKPAVGAPPSVPIPPSAAKQRIADILKGLEFGKGQDDSDDLEPGPSPAAAKAGEDLVDVDAAPIPLGEKSNSLANELKPNREGMSRNWLGTGSHGMQEASSAAAASQLPPIDVGPEAKPQSAAAGAAAADISAMSNEEFRGTFEFLKGDEPSPVEEPLFQAKFEDLDLPEDQKSLLAQAGLSADSLMNELSVMNELNALMQESAAQSAQTTAKEEASLQSLFREEAKEKESGADITERQDAERDQSLKSLMESLAQSDSKADPLLQPTAPTLVNEEEEAAAAIEAAAQKAAAEEAAAQKAAAEEAAAQKAAAEEAAAQKAAAEEAAAREAAAEAAAAEAAAAKEAAAKEAAAKEAAAEEAAAEEAAAQKAAAEEAAAQEAAAEEAAAQKAAAEAAAAQKAAVEEAAAREAAAEEAAAREAAAEEAAARDSAAKKAAAEEAAAFIMPTPILQTPDISLSDLMDAAAQFDETKTAESAPSLRLTHENFASPERADKSDLAAAHNSATTSSAFTSDISDLIAPTSEWSWAPKEHAASSSPAPAMSNTNREGGPAGTISSTSLEAASTGTTSSSTNLEATPVAATPAAPAASVNAAWSSTPSTSEPAAVPTLPPATNLAWLPASASIPAQSPGQMPLPAPAAHLTAPTSVPTAEEISSAWAPAPSYSAPPPPAPAAGPSFAPAPPPPAPAPGPTGYEHPAHPAPHPPVQPVSASVPAEATSNPSLPSPSLASPPAPPSPHPHPSLPSLPSSPPPAHTPAPLPPPPPGSAPVSGPTPQPFPGLADLNLPSVAPPLPPPHPSLAAQQMAAQIEHPATTNGDGDKSALHSISIREPASSIETTSPSSTTPQPEELIRKMQQLTTTPAPSWCTDFSFPFIEQLRKEHAQLAEQVRQLQNAMNGMEARLETVETLKVALLTGEQEAFLSASQEILTRVGWQVQASRNDANELWLVRGERVEAIARVVRSQSGTSRSDLAQLAQSVIAFWDKYETEPKGLLLAQNFAHQHPGERTEPDFAPALVEAAAKKSLCLMSSFQLLAMFKEGEMGQMTADEMRKRILETNGKLAGFALDSTVAQPATV